MKKFLSVVLVTLGILGLTACGKSNETVKNSNTIVVGATAVPHSEILNEVVDNLAEQGIILEIKVFSDYSLLNRSLSEGQLDANFFQHTPFLEKDMENSGAKLTSVGPIHIEPMGIYSKAISNLDEIKDGAKVSIPNDDTNAARALMLLEKNGLITLKSGVSEAATIFDIEENHKNLEIIPLDAATLPRTLDEVEIAVINTNYALAGGFNPIEDAIAIEDGNSPYSNILVVREGDENREEIKALYNSLTTEEIKTFIQEKYSGAIIPVF